MAVIYMQNSSERSETMTSEQIVKEIQDLDIIEFINFLNRFESSSIIGALLVEKWQKDKEQRKEE